MRPSERQIFDFETNTWVLADRFSDRTLSREIGLPSRATDPIPGRWTVPASPAKRWSPMSALIAMPLVSGPLCALVLHSFFPAVAGILAAIMIGIYGEAMNLDSRIVNDADRRLLENPDDRDVCVVFLEIVRDGRIVGRDKGVVWFADGMLLYNGHRTSFALGGEDVLPIAKWPRVQEAIGKPIGELGVPLRVEEGTAYVILTPLETTKGGGTPQEMRFLKRLYDFRRRPPTSKGPRQWPPFKP